MSGIEKASLSKQKNTFKRLQDSILYLRGKIDKVSRGEDFSEESGEMLESRLSALLEVNGYLSGFTWLNHKGSIERVKSFLACGCDYRYPVEVDMKEDLNEGVLSEGEWDEEFKKRLHRFETSIWYAAKRFTLLIGKDTIQMMLDGDLKAALYQFRSGVGGLDLESVVPSDLVAILPEAKAVTGLTVDECTKELTLLKELSYALLRAKFKGASKSKMSFLRYILESNDSRFAVERKLIYEFLESIDSDLDTLLYQLGARD